MKTKLTLGLLSIAAMAMAQGRGLYYVPNDTEETLPLKWSVGLNATWDSNTTPGGFNDGDDTFSLNPYVGVSFVTATPQTTWDVYARLGVIYYLDSPKALGSDDTYGQARIGVNLTHRFNERLRLVSRNFLAWELEPDYSYGFATTRQIGEYIFWRTDNALGYRWTDRFATYTGFSYEGVDYDKAYSNDRRTWSIYNQFRYQLSQQTVLTAKYSYSETKADGWGRDSRNQYLTAGVEHRFSPNTIAIAEVGAQFRKVKGFNGRSSTNPFLQASVRSQVNTQFSVRGFLRYAVEDYDNVIGFTRYDERRTLRLGVSGNYELSPIVSIYGGVDLVTADFKAGRTIPAGFPVGGSLDETLVNVYIGTAVKVTEYLTASLTYNYTDSDSDIWNRDYDRHRITLGVSAEF